MKVLVTGLCLSRNLGGPAMALTLVDQLRSRYKDIDFVFAVSAADYVMETVWAKHYGLNIVRRDSLLTHVGNNTSIGRFLHKLRAVLTGRRHQRSATSLDWMEIHDEYMQAFSSADIVICMEGISYVGDGTYPWEAAIGHYSTYYYAGQFRKPFCRFIQSFGPFDDWRVRLIAKRELGRLPFVMARGYHSAFYCRELLPNQEVYDVPDIAILLAQASDEWGNKQLSSWGLSHKDYTVLSPSAVIKCLPSSVTGSVGEKHIDSFVQIAETLLKRGEKLLFVPHMYSNIPEQCDREVCRRVMERLSSGINTFLVEEDIDPMQAKWLIAHAKQAVVSRYHALVAAVSTGTPVVTIGWNIKYADLLAYYGLEEMAVDARAFYPLELSNAVFQKLDLYESVKKDQLSGLQGRNVALVKDAFERLYRWIDAQ